VEYRESPVESQKIRVTELIAPMPKFTATERKVLLALADSDRVPTDEQLAARFVVSRAVIRTHLDHVYVKLDLGDGREQARFCGALRALAFR